MSVRPRASQRRWPISLIWAISLVVTVGCLGGVWVGCSVTPENYKVWAFFFDGVPDPATRAQINVEGGAGTSLAAAAGFIHKPYLDEQCDACHRSGLRFTRRDASGCLSCHDSVPTEHAYTHGPVAASACLWCHTPHESAFPHLLRESDRRLCTRCHSASLLERERVPEHGDPQRSCLECHTGHGADVRFNLRSIAPAGADASEER